MGQVLASIVIASMLPTFLLPAARGPLHAQFGSYERWIRAQLRVPADDAVEQAITSAVAAKADSFKEFLGAFLKSYEEAFPNRSSASAFLDRELNDEALLTYLQRRYTGVVDEGVLLRLYVSKSASSIHAGGKAGWGYGAFAVEAIERTANSSFAPASADRLIIVPLRILSSARSLGP